MSYRDVEDLLAERGLTVSNELIRRWVHKFGPLIAKNLRETRPKPHSRWHLDEMVVSYIQAHKSADNCAHRRKRMQFALLIYESPEAFATRNNDKSDSYTGAWRAYHKALVESGIFVGGDPLQVPETGTTVRLKEGKRRVQDGPYADTKEQLGGFTILELPSLDAALDWAGRCPAASYGAVEVRPLAPELRRRITE
jgi:hypothetical protein